MLVKLSDALYVAADQILSIQIREGANHVTVSLNDGTKHRYDPEYGEGVYVALDRLVALANKPE